MIATAEDDDTADGYDGEVKRLRGEGRKFAADLDQLHQQRASHGLKQEEQIAAVVAALADPNAPERFDPTSPGFPVG